MKIKYLNEIWRDIKGYESYYQVSNFGRIKSLERYDALGHHLKEFIMKPTYSSRYLRVSLSKNSFQKLLSVHRLVAEAFIPNPNNLPCVNHKDENRCNNFVYIDENGNYVPELSNLEWCTQKHNANWGKRNSKISKSKYKTILQFDLQGNFIKEWPSAMQLHKELNYSVASISQCCRGKQKTAYSFIWKFKTNY